MNKEKVWGIIKFYISKNLQNKWFIVFQIFLFAICLITTNKDSILSLLESHDINLFDEEVVLEILDKDNISAKKFETAFVGNKNIEVKYITSNEYTEETLGDDVIVVEIERNEKEIVAGKIVSKETIDYAISDSIAEVVTDIRADLFAHDNNIDLKELEIMNTPVTLDEIILSVNTDNVAEKMMINFISSFAMYILCFVVFANIAKEVAEEKVSKSIEYVFTSVSAKEYLFAKIAGIIIVLLLQMVYGIAYFIIGNFLNTILTSNFVTSASETVSTTMSIDLDITLYVLMVFIYGIMTLILMSIIQAALSSKATSMSDSGNTTLLLTMVTVFAYMITTFVITPYTNMTPIIYIISCIPLLSNFFVPAIIVIGQATTAQIIISLLLLFISIPVTFEICSKIFKNGVLDYSNKKSKINTKVNIERSIREEQEYKFKIAKYKDFSFVLGLTLILFVVFQLLFVVIVPMLITPIISLAFNEVQIELLETALILMGSLFFSFKVIQFYTEKRHSLKEINLSNKTKITTFLKAFFLFGLFQTILPAVTEFVGVEYDMNNILNFNLDGSFLTNLLLCFTVALVPAFFEELFFRKGIIDFSRRFGNAFALICSSLIFAVGHFNVLQGIFAFLAGLVLGSLYLKTGNLKMSILLHFINNLVGCFGMMIGENIELEILILVFYYGTMALGALVLFFENIKGFIKEYKEIKRFEMENTELEEQKKISRIDFSYLSNYKYVFCNYTFIVALVLWGMMFMVTENMIRL